MIALGLARALGLRGTVILACLLVLVVTAYGVAQDLGMLEPPAQASRPQASPQLPTQADPGRDRRHSPVYLRLYCKAGARYRIPWPVLAAVGKVESDHGRVRLPGVRSGSNWAGACGPMQIGCVPGEQGRQPWARYGHGRPHDPAKPSRPRPGIWSTTAPAATSTGRSTPTTTPGPTWPRSSSSPAATPEAVGAMTAAELGRADRLPAARSREELRLAQVASGLLLLLDAYRLTGRLPLEVQVQTSRLRHAVKLVIQAEAARSPCPRPPVPTAQGADPAAAALRAWIAAQPGPAGPGRLGVPDALLVDELAGVALPAGWGCRQQDGVDLAGQVALEAADDLGLGLALGGAPGDIGAGGWIPAQAAQGEQLERAVRVAVAAPVSR